MDDDGTFEGFRLNRGGFMRDLSTKVVFDRDVLKDFALSHEFETLMDNETRALFDLPPIAPTEIQLELPCVTTSGNPSMAVSSRVPADYHQALGSKSSRSAAGAVVRFGSVGASPLVRRYA